MTVTVVALVAACVVLPVPIVLGYGAARRRARGPRGAGPARRWGATGRAGSRFRAAIANAAGSKGAAVRYRRFGQSDLEVSEVGFGTWTLASDWWGDVDDKHGHAARRARRRHQLHRHRAGLRRRRRRRDAARRRPEDAAATRSCSPRSAATTSTPSASSPGQSERPHDWRPESIRAQLEASLRRLGTDHIDLYQLHNTRIEPILDDDLWEELEQLQRRGQGPRARRRARPGDRLGRGRARVDPTTAPIVSLQTVFNVLEQEPGLTFAAEPNGRRRARSG